MTIQLRPILLAFFAYSSSFGMQLSLQVAKKINLQENFSHDKISLGSLAALFALGVCVGYFGTRYIQHKRYSAVRAKWRHIIEQGVDSLPVGIHLSRDEKIEHIIDIVLCNVPGRCTMTLQDEAANDRGFLTAQYSVVVGSKSFYIACIDMLCVEETTWQNMSIPLVALATFTALFFKQDPHNYGIRIINYRHNERLQQIGERVGFVFEPMGDHNIGILNRDRYDQLTAPAVEPQVIWDNTE